jgi:hypothetical protein
MREGSVVDRVRIIVWSGDNETICVGTDTLQDKKETGVGNETLKGFDYVK